MTVTRQVAVLLPSAVVAVMVAVPADWPYKYALVELPDTVATEELLVVQVTFWLVAFFGLIFATNGADHDLANMVTVDGVIVTLVTAMAGATVATQVANLVLPSAAVAVIVAVPALLALMYA